MSTKIAKVFAVVDIGNTALKVSRITGQTLGEVHRYAPGDLRKLVTEQLPGEIGRVVVGSSGDPALAKDLSAQIFARGGEALILSRDCVVPFKSLYARGQAGVDRLANVAAVAADFKGQPVMVVDAGSAITVEKIGRGGVFYGGIILPGFTLQANALNTGTALLPLVKVSGVQVIEDVRQMNVPASDTKKAIEMGIFMACTGGVERVLRAYLADEAMAGAPIIFTGGDGELLLRELRETPLPSALEKALASATFDDGLTLRGLAHLSDAQ